MENLIWFYRSYGRLSCVRMRRCSQQQQQVRRRSCPRPLAVDPGPFLGFVSKPWQRTAGLRRTSSALETGRFAVIYRTVATSLRYLAAKQKGATPQVPGEGTDQLGGSDVKRLFELAKPERWKLAGAVGLLLMSSMVTMSVPFCMGKVIDIIYTHAQEGSMVEKLNSISQVLVIVFLMGGLANAGRVYLMQITGQNIIASLRKKLYSSILRQEIGFFDKTKTGELISRLAADAAVVGHSITMNISDGLRALAQAVGGVGMMLYVSPKLAGIALGIVPPVAAFSVLYGRYLRNITRRMQDSVADSTEIADERISNMRIVRAFVQEDKEYLTYSDKIRHMLKLAYKEAFARGLFFGFTGFSGNLIILSVFYYGGLMMAKSQLTIGELSSFILYAAYVGISMGGLSSFYSELMRGIGASSRLWKLIDRQPLIPVQGGQDLPQTIHGNIEFRDVLFSYPARKDVDVLSCFNLSVPAGSVTAVVGASGSGKSTLTALLLRYYDPTAGHVMLDGIDIKTVNPSQLRGCIGMVSQEPVLLSCSIAENIAYGSQDPSSVTMDVIEDSARKSNAYDFIQKFPNGFNTLVGERGVMLSGGQKQRIAIARALIKNPQILLLDEATSALDAESEALIQEALERVMEGRTVITIAHRLSTIKKADLIAVIHNKSVVELGTYMELMQITDGMFKKLVERQTITS